MSEFTTRLQVLEQEKEDLILAYQQKMEGEKSRLEGSFQKEREDMNVQLAQRQGEIDEIKVQIQDLHAERDLLELEHSHTRTEYSEKLQDYLDESKENLDARVNQLEHSFALKVQGIESEKNQEVNTLKEELINLEQQLQTTVQENQEREHELNDSSLILTQKKDTEIESLQSRIVLLERELQHALEDSKMSHDIESLVSQVQSKAKSKVDSLQNRINFLEGELSDHIELSRNDGNLDHNPNLNPNNSLGDISKIGVISNTLHPFAANATNLSSDMLHSLVGFLDQSDQGTQVNMPDEATDLQTTKLKNTIQEIKEFSKNKYKTLQERKAKEISELEQQVKSLNISLKAKDSILSKSPSEIANYDDIGELFSAVKTLDLENQKLKQQLNSSSNYNKKHHNSYNDDRNFSSGGDDHHYLHPIHHSGTVHQFHGVVHADGHIEDVYALEEKSAEEKVSFLMGLVRTSESELTSLRNELADVKEANDRQMIQSEKETGIKMDLHDDINKCHNTSMSTLGESVNDAVDTSDNNAIAEAKALKDNNLQLQIEVDRLTAENQTLEGRIKTYQIKFDAYEKENHLQSVNDWIENSAPSLLKENDSNTHTPSPPLPVTSTPEYQDLYRRYKTLQISKDTDKKVYDYNQGSAERSENRDKLECSILLRTVERERRRIEEEGVTTGDSKESKESSGQIGDITNHSDLTDEGEFDEGHHDNDNLAMSAVTENLLLRPGTGSSQSVVASGGNKDVSTVVGSVANRKDAKSRTAENLNGSKQQNVTKNKFSSQRQVSKQKQKGNQMTAVSPKILIDEFSREEGVVVVNNKNKKDGVLHVLTRDEFSQTDRYIEELEKHVKNARRILYVNRAQQLVIMSQRLLLREYKKGASASMTDDTFNDKSNPHLTSTSTYHSNNETAVTEKTQILTVAVNSLDHNNT